MRNFERRRGKPVTKARATTVFQTLNDAYLNRISLAEAGSAFRKQDTDETLREVADQSINLVSEGEDFSLTVHIRSMELVRKTAWRVANVLDRPESDLLYLELGHIVDSLKENESFAVDGMNFTVRDRLWLMGILVSDQGKKKEIVDDYAELRIAQGLIDPFNKNSDPGKFRTLTRRKVAEHEAYLRGEGAVSSETFLEFRAVRNVCESLARNVFKCDHLYEILDILPKGLSNYEIMFLFKEISSFFYDKNDPLAKTVFERLEKVLQFKEFIYFGPTEEELRLFLLDTIDAEGVEFFVDRKGFESSPFIKRGLASGTSAPFFDDMIRAFRLELFKLVKVYPENL